jgi:hypothetical protein
MGLLVNILLRLSIFYFLIEVLIFPDDPRFAGKAIPLRNFIIVITLSLLFPFLHFLKKRWKHYPVWADNLFLSIFFLDMFGNSLNLYDSYYYFDLIPHFHGPGALAMTLISAFSLPALSAIGVSSVVHILLEAQEYYTDLFLGTHNVRGTTDVVNDLIVGILGVVVYILIYRFFQGINKH